MEGILHRTKPKIDLDSCGIPFGLNDTCIDCLSKKNIIKHSERTVKNAYGQCSDEFLFRYPKYKTWSDGYIPTLKLAFDNDQQTFDEVYTFKHSLAREYMFKVSNMDSSWLIKNPTLGSIPMNNIVAKQICEDSNKCIGIGKIDNDWFTIKDSEFEILNNNIYTLKVFELKDFCGVINGLGFGRKCGCNNEINCFDEKRV